MTGAAFTPADARAIWSTRPREARTPMEWRAWARRRNWRSSNPQRIARRAVTSGAVQGAAYVLNADDSVTRVTLDGVTTARPA